METLWVISINWLWGASNVQKLYGNWGNDIIGAQGNYGNNINSLLVVCFTSSILAHNNIVANWLFSGKKILEMPENSFPWIKNFI
jgi:hypothetical protein